MRKLLLPLLILALGASLYFFGDRVPAAAFRLKVGLGFVSMPNLSAMTLTRDRDLFTLCTQGGAVWAEGYNKPGNEKLEGYDAIAFYDSFSAPVPFVVVLFEPITVEMPSSVYVDIDRDGVADMVGKPGERGIGMSPCHNLPEHSGAPRS